MKYYALLATMLSLLASGALKAEERSRFDGTISGGFSQFSVLSPSPDISMNNGTEFSLQAEKPFGLSPFYLVVSANYIKASGLLNYNYVSPTATYVASNVNYSSSDYSLDFGLRLKFFDSHHIRPYMEAGGSAGYLQVSYDSSLRTPAVVAAGTDYKTLENVLEFGYYGEAGLEIQFSSNWGVRAAYHYMNTTTRNVQTLKNQSIIYTGNIYYGGLFWSL
jgi:opacity protein-like surface antigen